MTNLGNNLRIAALLTLGKAVQSKMTPANGLRFKWIRDNAFKLERDMVNAPEGPSYSTYRKVEIDRDINLPRVIAETMRLARNERGQYVWER